MQINDYYWIRLSFCCNTVSSSKLRPDTGGGLLCVIIVRKDEIVSIVTLFEFYNCICEYHKPLCRVYCLKIQSSVTHTGLPGSYFYFFTDRHGFSTKISWMLLIKMSEKSFMWSVFSHSSTDWFALFILHIPLFTSYLKPPKNVKLSNIQTKNQKLKNS